MGSGKKVMLALLILRITIVAATVAARVFVHVL